MEHEVRMEVAPKIPDGKYRATFIGLGSSVKSEYGMSFKFKFKLAESCGKFGGEVITGLCNSKLTDKTKLNRWLIAMGAALSHNETVKIEQLAGTRVIVEVKEVKNYTNVVEIFPFILPQTNTPVVDTQSPPVKSPVQEVQPTPVEAPAQPEVSNTEIDW